MATTIDTPVQTPEVPGMSRISTIPNEVFEKKLSKTSSAAECFVNQRFSGRLQAYMIGYVGSIITNRSVYEA